MGKSEIAVFAWRHSARGDQDHKFWITWCNEWGKAWTFQKEKGDTGYEHYQGLISLKIRRTEAAAKKIIMDTSTLPEYFAPVANPNLKAGTEAFYVTKPETRIEGPWSDKDQPVYVPRHVRDMTTLYPWQQTIADSANVYDSRGIDLIVDHKGNRGKSCLTAYLRVHKIGRGIPFINDYKDLMRMVMDMPKSPLYLLDMPRAINKERLNQLWAAIETVKSGYAYDDRYTFKEADFDRPRIWVFTNEFPDMSCLSGDMWRFWEISENGQLTALALEKHRSLS